MRCLSHMLEYLSNFDFSHPVLYKKFKNNHQNLQNLNNHQNDLFLN